MGFGSNHVVNHFVAHEGAGRNFTLCGITARITINIRSIIVCHLYDHTASEILRMHQAIWMCKIYDHMDI